MRCVGVLFSSPAWKTMPAGDSPFLPLGFAAGGWFCLWEIWLAAGQSRDISSPSASLPLKVVICISDVLCIFFHIFSLIFIHTFIVHMSHQPLASVSPSEWGWLYKHQMKSFSRLWTSPIIMLDDQWLFDWFPDLLNMRDLVLCYQEAVVWFQAAL